MHALRDLCCRHVMQTEDDIQSAQAVRMFPTQSCFLNQPMGRMQVQRPHFRYTKGKSQFLFHRFVLNR